MNKKQLYFIIAVLAGILLYVFFSPAPVLEEVEPQEFTTDIQTVVDGTLAVEGVSQEPMLVKEVVVEPMTLEGTFVGLLDGEDPYQKKFKYMLVNDGVEVLRIDLRPLVGYSDINIVEKLGVDRGEVILASGTVTDGVFAVETIVLK